MKKILLAVGNGELENFLTNTLNGEYEFVGLTVYREGILKHIETKAPDIVIIRESLPGTENFLDIIYKIKSKYSNTRIVFIAGKREEGDPFISSIVGYSVYDILYGEKIPVNDIVEMIRNPNTFADVKHLRPIADELTIKKKESKEEQGDSHGQRVEKPQEKSGEAKGDTKLIKAIDKIIRPPKPEVIKEEIEKIVLSNQKILTFIGSKSGVGSTTLAINTAFSLAMNGLKVLFIEVDDTFPAVNYWFNIGKIDKGIETAIAGVEDGNNFKLINSSIIKTVELQDECSEMQSVYKKYPKTLDFLLFSQEFIFLKEKKVNYEKLKDLYFFLLTQGGYDYLVIDSKPNIRRKDILNNIIYSNKIIFTLTQDISSIGYYLYLLEDLNKKMNIESKKQLVLNKYDKCKLSYSDIKAWVNTSNLIEIPNENEEFLNANYAGLPVVLGKNKELIKKISNIIKF